jgi:hypothetical protein
MKGGLRFMPDPVATDLKDAVKILEDAAAAELRARAELEEAEDRMIDGSISRMEFAERYEAWSRAAGAKQIAERDVARCHAVVI